MTEAVRKVMNEHKKLFSQVNMLSMRWRSSSMTVNHGHHILLPSLPKSTRRLVSGGDCRRARNFDWSNGVLDLNVEDLSMQIFFARPLEAIEQLFIKKVV